jgi:hypothetical protein
MESQTLNADSDFRAFFCRLFFRFKKKQPVSTPAVFLGSAVCLATGVLFAGKTGRGHFIDITLTTSGGGLLRHHADLFASFDCVFADRNTGA